MRTEGQCPWLHRLWTPDDPWLPGYVVLARRVGVSIGATLLAFVAFFAGVIAVALFTESEIYSIAQEWDASIQPLVERRAPRDEVRRALYRLAQEEPYVVEPAEEGHHALGARDCREFNLFNPTRVTAEVFLDSHGRAKSYRVSGGRGWSAFDF